MYLKKIHQAKCAETGAEEIIFMVVEDCGCYAGCVLLSVTDNYVQSVVREETLKKKEFTILVNSLKEEYDLETD